MLVQVSLGPVPAAGYLMCLCHLIDSISWTSHHFLQWGLMVSKTLIISFVYSSPNSFPTTLCPITLHSIHVGGFGDRAVRLLRLPAFINSLPFTWNALCSSFSLGEPFLLLWNFSSPSGFDYFSSFKIQCVHTSFITFIRTYCSSLFPFCLSWWTEFEWNLCLCRYICDTQHLWHWR